MPTTGSQPATAPSAAPAAEPDSSGGSGRLERLTYPRELLANLTLRELRGKYKRSVLGWGWSVINPTVMILVYTMVFSVFLGQQASVGDPSGMNSYAFFLMGGLLPWLFLANGINGAVSSLTANEGLIKKVYFPRSILPTASTLAWLATFAIEMAVYGVLLLVIGGNMVLPWIPLIMVVAIIEFFFVLGLGLLVSPANAYFRDVEHFTNIFLMIWFWSTPILYQASYYYNAETGQPKEILGVQVPTLANLNPMLHFVTAYRNLAYDLRFPTASTWAHMITAAVVTMGAGYLVFRRLEPNLAEEL